MATINFYLDTRATGWDKPAPLKISVRHRNKSTLLPTGISLLPEQWDNVTRKVVNHPNRMTYNNALARRILDVELCRQNDRLYKERERTERERERTDKLIEKILRE